jgi:hypothetical protein
MVEAPRTPGQIRTHPARTVLGRVCEPAKDQSFAVRGVLAEALAREVIAAEVLRAIETNSANSLGIPVVTARRP